MRLRLDETTEMGGWFYQRWVIIADGDEHQVESRSQWGCVDITKGGERLYDVAGTPICAGQIVGCAISVLPGPVEDGDNTTIDAEWLDRVCESGVRRDCLTESP